MEIDFHTSENVSFVNVIMISKGVIVRTDKINIINHLGNLVFNAKFEFAPTTNIIAYYINDKKEVISDSRTIYLRDRLPNYVSRL